MRLWGLIMVGAMLGCEPSPTEGNGDSGGGPGTDSGGASGSDSSGGGEAALCDELVDPPVKTAVLRGSDPLLVPLTGMCMIGTEAGTERFDYYVTPSHDLGMPFWEYPRVSDLLADPDLLAQYDLLVVAKGAGNDTDQLWDSAVFMENASAPNLREYVRNGGNILTSEEGFVELLFPAVVDFRGHDDKAPGETEMVSPTGIRQGRTEDPLIDPEVRAMDIVDDELGKELAARQCENRGDGFEGPCAEGGQIKVWLHDLFPIIEGAHAGAELDVLLRGEVFFFQGDFDPLGKGDHPMVVRFTEGKGTVVFSGIHFGYVGLGAKNPVGYTNGQLFEALFESVSR